MNRDLILPALAMLVGVCALVAYGNHRRSCRRVRDVQTHLDQPLQTWEEEGGALRSSGQAAAEPPRA